MTGCDSESFGVFRRKNDWFLWRAEPCDQQEAVFRVVCTRHAPLFDPIHPHFSPEAGKKLPEVPMEKMIKPEEEMPAPVVVQLENTAQTETTNKVDEHLPEAVDTILRAMFPSYRKARQ